jgi:site-specific recombinase XerD
MELPGLALYDIDLTHRLVMVREGKGKRDRAVPIGERAAAWVEKYLHEARPQLLVGDTDALFLTDYGEPMAPEYVAERVRRYMHFAGIKAQRCTPVPTRLRHTHVGQRRRHALHPGASRSCRSWHHADIYPRLDRQAERNPRCHAPGEAA